MTLRKSRIARGFVLVLTGAVLGLFPGCVEVFLLNIATPFLL